MKYKFTISLTGEMEAKSELELVEKVTKMINGNFIFNKLAEAFDVKLERGSIEGEEDDTFMDRISKDFNIEIEEEKRDFYGIPIETENLTHEIKVGNNNA